MRKLIIYMLLMVLALGFSACSKYEDGPALSIRTKKARLTGTWKYSYSSITSSFSYYILWTFEPDGDFEEDSDYYSGGDGTWSWEDGKSDLSIRVDGYLNRYEIQRLTNDELTVMDDDGDLYYFHKQ